MTAEPEESTAVKIFHQVYHLQSGGDTDYVRELASYVDRHMVEVSHQTPTVDTLKVAILAALNIADECACARKRLECVEAEICDKSAFLNELLKSGIGSKVS